MAALVAAAVLAWAPATVLAQGAGSAGAEILKLVPGARAAALAGAYTAATADADGVFFNPASAGWLGRAASAGYQVYVEDVSIGSASAAYDLGRIVLTGGLVFLDAGSIEEVIPDPDFGGQTGQPTGETVSATESAARVGAAMRLLDDRVSVGAVAGLISSDLAGISRSAAFFDIGAQYRLAALTFGASLRNMGGDLDSEGWGGASLPSELRLGATYSRPLGGGYGAAATGDLVRGLAEETTGFALGIEGGLMPTDAGITAVLRAGIELGEAEEHLGRLRFGGGVAYRGLGLDYTVQAFDFLGTIHRIGIRWTAP